MSAFRGFVLITACPLLASLCAAAPVILSQPKSLALNTGQVAIFKVAVESGATFTWFKDGAPLTDNDRLSGANAPHLSISPARPGDAGSYTVVVSDGSGDTPSQAAILTLDAAPPAFLAQPENVIVNEGDAVSLTTTAVGHAPIANQWTRFGIPLADDSRISGTTGPVLQLDPVQTTDAGLFWPTLSNVVGTVTGEPVRVTVTTPSLLGESADFSQGPWTTSGGGWAVQDILFNTGTSALRSDPIAAGQQADIETIVHGPGTLNFHWAVQSEGGYDVLLCYVDGIEVGRISGDSLSWTSVSVPLEWGTHVIRWTYAKDGSVDVGLDAGYLDTVSFTPETLTSLETSLPGLPFSLRSFGSALWFGQSKESIDGIAARAGYISHGESSTLETMVCGPGQLSFDWKSSSEGSDPLQFLLNGVVLDGIAGTGDWSSRTVQIPWGIHTLAWTYSKDGSADSGQDTAWLDSVVFTPTLLTSLTEASGAELSWRSSGQYPFFGQVKATLDANGALQSGPIDHGSSSSAHATVTGPGTLRFQWRASTEAGYDTLKFMVSTSEKAAISGEVDWAPIAYSIRPGTHALEWVYSKDGGTASGFDAVWIDQVSFTAAPPIAVAIDAPYLAWNATGEYPWFQDLLVSHDGIAAMRSGDVPDGESTSLLTQIEGPGLLSFNWKVSSESYDGLTVHVDGVEMQRISGIQEWAPAVVAIPSGIHEIEWRYSKDGGGVQGDDAGWIDTVQFLESPTYATWSQARFTEEQLAQPEVSAPEANPSNDGIPNLLKYAFNLDPKTSAAGDGLLQPGVGTFGLPFISRTPDGHLQVEMLRRKGALGLTYTVEFCTNLDGPIDTWAAATAQPTVLQTSNPNWERVLIVDAPPIGALRRFARVRVTETQ